MRSTRSIGLGCLSLLTAAGALAGCSVSGSPPVGASGTFRDVPIDRAPEGSAGSLARIDRKQQRLRENGPKRMDNPAEAMEYFLAQRLGRGMTEYPIDVVQNAIRETRDREQLILTQRGELPGDINGWTHIGPGNIGGRTRAMLINPENPDIMYAAGVGGGVFKSTNAGATWAPTSDDLVNIAVCSMVMDPTEPDTIYAGTGEGYFNSDGIRGLGIFKTTNGGETWEHLQGTIEPAVPFGAFFRCNKLVISPNDPDRIYAATRTAVWTSPDAGATWAPLLDNPNVTDLPGVPEADGSFAGFTDIALRQDVAPGGPDVIFACAGSFDPDGVYRSADGGTTWQRLGTGADLQRSDQGRMTISIAPTDNDIVYVAMANNGSTGSTGQFVEIYRSTDGGDTWEARADFSQEVTPFLFSNLIFGAGCFGSSQFAQGWYDNIIKVDPSDSEVVWVGGVDLFRSDDGGRTFGIASYWWLDFTFDNYVHADQHELVFHPDYDGVTNTILYSGSDGGVYRTDNALAPTSLEDCPFDQDFNLDLDAMPEIVWQTLNRGYGVTQFYHGASASDHDVFIAGAQDNGTSRVSGVGTPNAWFEILGGDGGYCAINPQDNDVMYAETQFFPSMIKSTDGGNSWSDANNGITDNDGSFINPFAMDPSMPDVLWSGGSRPWRTINGAQSWVPAGPDFSGPGDQSAIAVAPSDSNTVYYGFEDGYIARSSNALDLNPDWTVFAGVNGLPEENATISSIAVDPNDPDTAYATSSTFGVAHVYRTSDGGQSWTPIDGDVAVLSVPEVPVHWIAIRPCNTQQLYVGTEVGVFASDDAGATWGPANLGLANTVVETLEFKDENTLVAFTHGRGAFVATLDPCGDPKCAIDYNADTVIDMNDITFFLLLYAQMDPLADIAPPLGVWDFSDIFAFLFSFTSGCP